MSTRRNPDALSWRMTPDTVLREERAFHEIDGDVWVFEQFNEDAEEWEYYEGPPLRLTCFRSDDT